METMIAFARGQAAQGNRHRVFDWDEAARRIKASGATEAGAGLSDDWEWTGGEIFADGKPVAADDTYVYLASSWAAPELDLGGEIGDCWIYADQTDGWGPETYWPDSARAILDGKAA